MTLDKSDPNPPLLVSDWPPLERFERAAGIAGIGHYVWDVVADRCLLCSEEHAAIHGMTRDAYIAQASTIDNLAHPDDRDIVREAFYRLRAGERFEVEYRLVTSWGETRYIREIGHPVFDDDGHVVQEMGTTQDITHQKRTELELRNTREILSEGLRALPLGFAFFDKDGRLKAFNEAYRSFLHITGHLLKPGIHVEDIVRSSAAIIAPRFGYDDPEIYVADRLAAARSGDKSWTYKQSNGRWIKLFHRPTQSGGFVTVMEDVTAAKDREEQLLQSQKMEAVGQLTGGIAHDFNNLLAVILGNAELLESLDPQFNPMVQDIIKAAERGSQLTKGLLAFSRRQMLSAQPIDVVQLLTDFVSLLNRTLGEDIVVRFRHNDALWAAFADRAHLENAILNLALNARDAMPSGGELFIHCRNLKHTGDAIIPDGSLAPGAYVVIEVTNTGVGMTEDQKTHAFEPFYTSKGVGKGTGLGLSSVFGFAKQSGGTAHISATSDSGTSVEIWLPKSGLDVPRPLDRKRNTSMRGQGESILIIEDDTGVQDLAARLLREAGFHPVCVPDVQSARNVLAITSDFDLVLSDVVLPGGSSGPDFAVEMKQQGNTIPFLFMTGYVRGIADQTELENAAYVLRKPFSKTELLSAITGALADKRSPFRQS